MIFSRDLVVSLVSRHFWKGKGVYKHEKRSNPLNTEIMTFADTHTDRQPLSKHLKGRSVPPCVWRFWLTGDFVVFPFLDTFRRSFGAPPVHQQNTLKFCCPTKNFDVAQRILFLTLSTMKLKLNRNTKRFQIRNPYSTK